MLLIAKTRVLPWNEKNIDTISDLAGVILFRNASKQVIFIGIAPAGQLYDRLLQHFHASDIPNVTYFECFQMASEEEARLWGRALISRIRPVYNMLLRSNGI